MSIKQIIENNCEIVEYDSIIQGLSGTNRKIYSIRHLKSNIILHTISLSEACCIARLMDLDNTLYDYYKEI